MQFLSKRTKYNCNHRKFIPNMIETSEFILESRDYDFWTNFYENKFSMIAIIFGLKAIAFIYSPLYYQDAFILGPHYDYHNNHISSPP